MQPMEEVYREHAQTVYRYLLSLTHDPSIAEELTQETFYQAVKGAARFDGRCKVSTWLCAIAKNQLSVYRRKHRVTEELEEGFVSDGSADGDLLASESRVELLRKLHALGEETREVIYLRVFGELSFREIGDILSRTENWARVTFYRGKEKLKKEMRSDER